MKEKQRRNNESGFTVVELAVALFIMLMIVVPLMYRIYDSLRVSNQLYYLTTCAFLAEQKIEEVRARASCYSEYTNPPNSPNCPESGAFSLWQMLEANDNPYFMLDTLDTDQSGVHDVADAYAGPATEYYVPCKLQYPFYDTSNTKLPHFECGIRYVPPDNTGNVFKGGGVDRLFREIQVKVWFDDNANNLWDAGETNVMFQTGLTWHAPAWRN